MEDEALLRYSRQILLPQVGHEGQQRLLGSHALIVGLGGLGSPVALYLAAGGVGRLTLADPDRVDLSNLQRQIVHGTADIGDSKVLSAARTIAELNPGIGVSTIADQLAGDALEAAVAAADVVLDCSDNFPTRFALNAASVATGTPLVSAAVIRMEGQVIVFDPRRSDSPCYRCLYADTGAEAEACSQNGVMAPVAGIVGSVQATEALKLLAGIQVAYGRLMLIDAERMEWRTLRLPRDPGCPVCACAEAALP